MFEFYLYAECVICLEPLSGKKSITSCGHVYHTECIKSCVSSGQKNCPICRIMMNGVKDLLFDLKEQRMPAELDPTQSVVMMESIYRALDEKSTLESLVYACETERVALASEVQQLFEKIAAATAEMDAIGLKSSRDRCNSVDGNGNSDQDLDNRVNDTAEGTTVEVATHKSTVEVLDKKSTFSPRDRRSSSLPNITSPDIYWSVFQTVYKTYAENILYI
eukprot:GHVR01154549.1.p2 GENE.GHVR01154549.1~~GHVR01154549.1.p2  ORF type:complete len:220 (+),score=29.24 GHVR01154549.1:1727-2386(+)